MNNTNTAEFAFNESGRVKSLSYTKATDAPEQKKPAFGLVAYFTNPE